jgi:hypothetical protein
MGDDVANEGVSWGPLPKVTWAEMARAKNLSAIALIRSSTWRLSASPVSTW